MAEYHVGCGTFGIYAGTLNKNKTMWVNKSECTDEVIIAAAEYLIKNNKTFKFAYNDKKYILKVEKLIEV